VRRLAGRAVLLLCLTASVLPAWAQEASRELDGRSPWALLAQALLSLAVVVGVIYLMYFGLRRLTDRGLGADAAGPLRVLQARHLGGDHWLYVVEVEGRRMVVGATSTGMALIAELEPSGATGGGREDEV